MASASFNLLVGLALLAIVLSLLWPERGLLARWRNARRQNRRVLTEDALKHIYEWEVRGERPSLETIAGGLEIGLNETAQLIEGARTAGLVRTDAQGIFLTSAGSESALHIIRAHRLWERFLADETGYANRDWHVRAEKHEHDFSREELDNLAARLGNPSHDPDGDPIPQADGDPVRSEGSPLSRLPPETLARVVHVEDEPAVVYSQLVAMGINPGMVVRVIESTAERVRIWADGNEHVLAPLVAANVSAVPLAAAAAQGPEDGMPLSELRVGLRGHVLTISRACRGAERRRFLDLGLVPGTLVTAELRSPAGDPTAYRIRDALIALRREQARHVRVKALEVTP